MATNSHKKSAKKTGSERPWRAVVTKGSKVSAGASLHATSKTLRNSSSRGASKTLRGASEVRVTTTNRDAEVRVTSKITGTTLPEKILEKPYPRPRNKKPAKIDLEIKRKNDELRSKYLQTAKLYTAEDVRKIIAKNPQKSSDPSSKWKCEGRVFAIQDGEKDRFPVFQFADGQPLPIIKKILKALPEDLTPWQTAFWFQSANGWLDGKSPQECLTNEKEVITAAEQLGNLAIG